jgi:hypothetical protein
MGDDETITTERRCRLWDERKQVLPIYGDWLEQLCNFGKLFPVIEQISLQARRLKMCFQISQESFGFKLA